MDFLRFVVAVIAVSDGLLGNDGRVAAVPCWGIRAGLRERYGETCVVVRRDGFVARNRDRSVVAGL
jgi:hypothetical protein